MFIVKNVAYYFRYILYITVMHSNILVYFSEIRNEHDKTSSFLNNDDKGMSVTLFFAVLKNTFKKIFTRFIVTDKAKNNNIIYLIT